MRHLLPISIVPLIFLPCCNVIQKTPKTALTDGFYRQKTDGKKAKVYIDTDDELLTIHPVKRETGANVVDTVAAFQVYPPELHGGLSASFSKQSFDLDFLTIPLKFRPSQTGVPGQLNTNLNGAVYVGFRTDRFKIKYKVQPMGMAERHINHFGFSTGVVTGIGNTFMSPTNTNNILQQEYDGIVWGKGIAFIIGINNFSIGLTAGIDNLLDQNKNIWIYESKPWFGLAFGLNLN